MANALLRLGLLLVALAGAAPAVAGQPTETLPVPAATIYPGDRIEESMLADALFPAGTLEKFPMVAERTDLVGKVARRTLLPGKLVVKNNVAEPDLVSRGTIVQAVFAEGGLVISTPVLALQSGSIGALIQVRNVDSGKVVIGEVAADGTIRVGGK